MIRVLLVDDHEVVRQGLRLLLETSDEIEVVGEASDGVEALRAVADDQPDVVLMDIRMPRLDGIEATERLRVDHPEVAVVILTTYNEDALLLRGLRAGARGYLLKGAGQDEVVRAIGTVHAGGVVFGASLAARVTRAFAAPANPRAAAFPPLTDREREVLDLIAAGRTNAQIAAELFLSGKTVRNNVSTILSKLQAGDRANVIIRARDAGFGHSS